MAESFRQFLNESGFAFEQYAEEVHEALCLLGDYYKNADLYYQDELEAAYESDLPVNKCAADIAAKFDSEFRDNEGFTPENGYEDYEKEYGKSLPELTDDNENYEEPEFIDKYDFTNDVNEATEQDDGVSDGESYEDWKMNAFKYIDKRVYVDKVKELGSYIKTFLKQEFDNGEPSWFMAAESIVNYVRTNYPDCLKDRSFATNITESI